jgi:hypothetical protein
MNGAVRIQHDLRWPIPQMISGVFISTSRASKSLSTITLRKTAYSLVSLAANMVQLHVAYYAARDIPVFEKLWYHGITGVFLASAFYGQCMGLLRSLLATLLITAL